MRRIDLLSFGLRELITSSDEFLFPLYFFITNSPKTGSENIGSNPFISFHPFKEKVLIKNLILPSRIQVKVWEAVRRFGFQDGDILVNQNQHKQLYCKINLVYCMMFYCMKFTFECLTCRKCFHSLLASRFWLHVSSNFSHGIKVHIHFSLFPWIVFIHVNFNLSCMHCHNFHWVCLPSLFQILHEWLTSDILLHVASNHFHWLCVPFTCRYCLSFMITFGIISNILFAHTGHHIIFTKSTCLHQLKVFFIIVNLCQTFWLRRTGLFFSTWISKRSCTRKINTPSK